jgi:hypothetical protein
VRTYASHLTGSQPHGLFLHHWILFFKNTQESCVSFRVAGLLLRAILWAYGVLEEFRFDAGYVALFRAKASQIQVEVANMSSVVGAGRMWRPP